MIVRKTKLKIYQCHFPWAYFQFSNNTISALFDAHDCCYKFAARRPF